jgi:hypothetical protein
MNCTAIKEFLMFCYNCGKQLSDADKFCGYCSAPQASAAVQTQTPVPDQFSAPPYVPHEFKKKSNKGVYIALISVIAVIAIALSVYFLVFRDLGSLAQVGRALYNTGREVEERFDQTPLKALTMLGDILEDGTVTADFTYTASLLGNFLTADIDGTIRLSSDSKARNFALEAQVGTFGESVNIDAYMDRERLALRLPILDNNFYGIRYSTFRDDIRVLGNLTGLDNRTMDQLSDMVDQLNAIMNTDEATEDFQAYYVDAVRNFAGNLEIRRQRTSIESNDEQINCQLIEITITKEAILTFLTDVYDITESNESVQTYLSTLYSDNLILQGFYGGFDGGNDRLLSELSDAITDFEKNYSGDIVLSFYIGGGDRLLRAEVNADISYNYYPARTKVVLDFGRSVEDDWLFDIDFEFDDLFAAQKFTIYWTFEEHSGNYTNTITIAEGTTDTITLISEWNINRYDFMLSYINGPEKNTITGVFTTDDKNFYLRLDDLFPENTSNSLRIEISTQTGVQIDEINFINIDSWGTALIESVMRLLPGGNLFLE